jgi:peptidylprolyl isomerase
MAGTGAKLDAMRTAAEGDLVRAHVVARLADGSVWLDSRLEQPIDFKAGGGDVLPGVARAVVGMAQGEIRLLALAPEDAYGTRDEDLVARLPREHLALEVAVGDTLQAERDGAEMTVWVKEVTAAEVVLDGNHPLAGCTLLVEIELLDVLDA